MAEEPPPVAISSAFPAPPPFYKSFTTENLEAQKTYLESINHPPSDPLPTQASGLDLLSLPPELRNLFPPAPPADGKYRSFGITHDINPSTSTSQQTTPTPARLQYLTQKLLITFLHLTSILATNPAAYAPIWDELHGTFQEVHEVINGYRPHQARETLILMIKEQLETVSEETKAVRESVERAREVVKGLRKEGVGGGEVGGEEGVKGKERRRGKPDGDRRVWEVLEKEVGRI